MCIYVSFVPREKMIYVFCFSYTQARSHIQSHKMHACMKISTHKKNEGIRLREKVSRKIGEPYLGNARHNLFFTKPLEKICLGARFGPPESKFRSTSFSNTIHFKFLNPRRARPKERGIWARNNSDTLYTQSSQKQIVLI